MSATDWQSHSLASKTLEVFLLGCVDFPSAMRLQDRMWDEIASRTDSHGLVFVCEHPPTITIGSEGSFADVLVDQAELTSRQVDVRWISRGGGTFVHAPGQVAVYSILPPDRLKLGAAEFRDRLEQVLLLAAGDLHIPAERSVGAPGAVCRTGQFAFIGAGIREGVTHDGFFVNVSVPPEALSLVRWSESSPRITTVEAQRVKPMAISTVRECLVRRLAEVFGYEDYQLQTGHPSLKRTTRKVFVFS